MLPRLSLLALAALAGGLAAPAAARAASAIFPYQVFRDTLENGLQVVVIPYDSPGTVAYHTIVRTGSRDEVEAGHSGFAHFFEHMMFRGTERYSPEVYNDVLKRMGADSNAFTSDDRTQYHIVGPAAELETMMDIESDRFRNLRYAEDAFRTEALAVLGEYNKNASSPFLPMWEKMRDLAYRQHTYKHTTMGFLEDIEAMPGYYQYSLSFFDRFYRPENCILLIVGDAEPARVFELARRHYGDWKPGYKAPAIASEPPQTERKTARLDWPNPIRPHLMIGYHVPAFSATTADTAALDVISQLLFSESAPLYQKLVVEEQWVDFLQGGYSDHRDPFLFTIFTRVKSEDLVPKVEAAMEEAIGELHEKPVEEARLERIKSHLRYSFALSLDSPGAVAATISGYLNLTGDPESVNQVYEQYQKVAPADVQRVAREVFQPTRQTFVTLAHQASEPAAQPAAAEGR